MRRKFFILAFAVSLVLCVTFFTLWCRNVLPKNLLTSASDPQVTMLWKQRRTYQSLEGPGHRGKEFEQLAVRLMLLRQKHPRITVAETFDTLNNSA
jgi:hypothetical protein